MAIPAGGTVNRKIAPMTPGMRGTIYSLKKVAVLHFLIEIHSDSLVFLEIVCIFIHKTDKVDYNEFCKRF